MKRILILLALLSTNAFAELPPPGTARKGPIKVKPEGMEEFTYDLQNQKVINRRDSRRVQAQINSYRERIKILEDENRSLRSQPRAAMERSIDTRSRPEPRAIAGASAAPGKKNRLSILAGFGPSSLRDNRKEPSAGNEITIDNSPILGGLYQRSFELFSLPLSAGAGLTLPTVPDTKKPTYIGSLGYDW